MGINENIWATSIEINNDDIWMLNGGVCSIWKYNIVKDKLEFIDIPKTRSYQNEWQYISIVIAGSKLFLIPYDMNDVAVYDIEGKEWLEPIKIATERDEGARFIGAVRWKDNIYCIPENRPDEMTVIDTNDRSVKELVNIWKELPDESEQINEIKVTDDGQIIGIVRYKKIAFIYDTKTKNTRLLIDKTNTDRRWNTIDCIQGQLFINGPESEEIEIYDFETLDLIKRVKIPFTKSRINSVCDKLIIDATAMDDLVIFDAKNSVLKNIDIQEIGSITIDREYMTGAVAEYDGKVIYHDRRRSSLLIIDADVQEIRKLRISEKEMERMKNTIATEMKGKTFFEPENSIVGLKEFINVII